MHQVIMEASALALPQEFAKKIGAVQVMLKEVDEGILISPITRKPRKLRGVLKGTGYSTAVFFEQKASDKELEP